MSTVKATNFQHPSAVAAGITLGSDGSVVLPSGFTGGLGTNVVQVVKTDTQSSSLASAASIAVSGLSASITPTSATSKILVSVQLTGHNGSEAGVAIIVKRDGTPIGVGASPSNRTPVSAVAFGITSGLAPMTTSAVILDAPTTTSAVTYSVDIFNFSSVTRTLYVNRSSTDTDDAKFMRSASSITAIEVAA